MSNKGQLTFKLMLFGPKVESSLIKSCQSAIETAGLDRLIFEPLSMAELPYQAWSTQCYLLSEQQIQLRQILANFYCFGECDWVLLPDFAKGTCDKSGHKKQIDSQVRWVIFDMDSTLIETEVIDELAALAGVKQQVAQVTLQAMQGDLDFTTSFKQRMQHLRGLAYDKAETLVDQLPITPGVVPLINQLKAKGIKTAIVSGGFGLFARSLQAQLGIDWVKAHELEVVRGQLTGEVLGEVIDGQRKLEIVRHLLQEEGVAPHELMVVGDGANDIPMLEFAGLGVAYRAKAKVNQYADVIYSCRDLSGILAFL